MAHGPEKKSKGGRKKATKPAARKSAAKRARKPSTLAVRPGNESSTSILSGEARGLIRDAFLNRP